MTIVCEKKMIQYNETTLEKIKIYDKNIDLKANLGKYMDYDKPSESNFIYRSGKIIVPELKWIEPLKQEIQHFIDCISTNTPCLTGIDHALQVVDILSRASKKNV